MEGGMGRLGAEPRVLAFRHKPTMAFGDGPLGKNRSMEEDTESLCTESAEDDPDSLACSALRLKNLLIPANSTFKVYWDWLVMVATFYVGIVTPYNAAFNSPQGDNAEVKIGNILIDVLFVVDIVIKFRTTYYDEAGHEVRSPRRIALNYLLGWFWIDVVAGFPYDILEAFVDRDTLATVLLVKCLRVLRLARLFNILERYSQYSSVILAVNMVTYVLFAHWFACVWYVIGRREYEDGTEAWNIGWLYKLDRASNPANYQTNKPESGILSASQRYWTAMYFSLTLITTVGFGNEAANSVAEKAAVCVAMPIAALMHALVFGNVTAIVQRLYARRFAYDILCTELEDFSKIYAVPRPLRRSMLSFTRTLWTANRGISYHKLVADFPDEMRAEIYSHIFRDFLSAPLFAGAPMGCRKAIALQMRDSYLTPKEALLSQGDTVRSLYFLASGSARVARHGRPVATLGKGQIFGPNLETCRYFAARSGYDVRITAATKLHCLSIAGLSYALSTYEEFHALLRTRLPELLAFDLCPEVLTEEPASPLGGLIPFVSMDADRFMSQALPSVSNKIESMSVALGMQRVEDKFEHPTTASRELDEARDAKETLRELRSGLTELRGQLRSLVESGSQLGPPAGPRHRFQGLQRELTFYDHINMHF